MICPGPLMSGPAGRNMFRPGPAHMCAGQYLYDATGAGSLPPG